MSDDRNSHEYSAEEQAPEAPPECSARAPKLDPVPGAIEPDHLFISMIALADNTQVLHVEAGGGQLLDCRFGGGMFVEDGNDRVGIFHRNSPWR